MIHTLSMLDKISEERTVVGKKKLIKEAYEDLVFRRVVSYALAQGQTYNLTGLPELPSGLGKAIVNVYNKISSPIGEETLMEPQIGEIFNYLDFLSSKTGATKEESWELSHLCGTSDHVREVVNRILKKDLRCGADAKTFNSIKKDWVYKVPYQRYKSFKFVDKLDFKNDMVIAQIKQDGMFSYMEFTGDDFIFTSRNGSMFTLGGAITSIPAGEWAAKNGLVWMGELLVAGSDGKYLPRKTGNGIINKFISGSGDPSYKGKIRYVTWGFITRVDYDNRVSTTTYEDMWKQAIEYRSKVNKYSPFILSKTREVKNLLDATTFYTEVRLRDEEGVMLKVSNRLCWKDQQSGTPYGIKMKPVAEADMEIVSAYAGKKGKKYADVLGGLVVKSSCGAILTKIGMGFSDEERNLGVDWWNKQKGKVVAVQFTGVITDKTSRETMCFDSGRFIETRFNEKTAADTLKYCQNEVNSK